MVLYLLLCCYEVKREDPKPSRPSLSPRIKTAEERRNEAEAGRVIVVWLALLIALLGDGFALFVPHWLALSDEAHFDPNQRDSNGYGMVPYDPEHFFNEAWGTIATWLMYISFGNGILVIFVTLLSGLLPHQRFPASTEQIRWLSTSILSIINAFIILISFTLFAIGTPSLKIFVLGFSAWCALTTFIVYLLISIYSFYMFLFHRAVRKPKPTMKTVKPLEPDC